MAKKHFMMYYKKGTGTFIITEPMPWARENKRFFESKFDFIKKFPTTNAIEKLLKEKYSFQTVHDDENISLIQNLNPNLDL
jgi:hypothetical protein